MKQLFRGVIAFVIFVLITLPGMAGRNVYASAAPDIAKGAAGIGRNYQGVSGNEQDTELSHNDEFDIEGTIPQGVYADNIDLSGMTAMEALEAVNSYIAAISNSHITLNSIDGNSAVVTPYDLGLSWVDKDFIKEAVSFGRSGNPIQKYKELKDLEHNKKVYPLNITYDSEVIEDVIMRQGKMYDIPSKNVTMERIDGEFHISGGEAGKKIDVATSVQKVEDILKEYEGGDITIDLAVIDDDPKEMAEQLSKVKDLLGTFTTSFSSSGKDRSGNVSNGTRLINGTLLMPGEQFSTYNTVSPFTEENGYFLAGSYLNGMVVESLGGGICQVSSTLYNAVLRAELKVDERYNHSMIVNYVKMSSDAAISGTSKDFKFTNSSEYPIYIEGYTTDDKEVVFNIYGVETRPANRTLEFESVELSKTEPVDEKIVLDASMPLGSVSVQSPHTGYSGEFWKIVKVDGVETERVRINKSNYLAAPKTATVGIATDNPAALSAVQAAAATGSIDYVRSTVSQLNAAAAAAVAGQ